LKAAPYQGAAMFNWVRDGYRPQNPVLQDAGLDDVTIGAMPFYGAGGGGTPPTTNMTGPRTVRNDLVTSHGA